MSSYIRKYNSLVDSRLAKLEAKFDDRCLALEPQIITPTQPSTWEEQMETTANGHMDCSAVASGGLRQSHVTLGGGGDPGLSVAPILENAIGNVVIPCLTAAVRYVSDYRLKQTRALCERACIHAEEALFGPIDDEDDASNLTL